jgi:predicted nucleic acid-binding protein
MIDTKKFVAVLDANVLYPAPLRDFLLRLAQIGLFIPKWSGQIHDEWTRNLLSNRPDLTASQLNKTKQAMDTAFPDANVTGFKKLISGLNLPDKDDRHVLAAAIKCEANTIITFNKKDFPLRSTYLYDIEIINPDEFISQLLEINLPQVVQAFLNQVEALRKPPQTAEQLLSTLEKCSLTESVAKIKSSGIFIISSLFSTATEMVQ